MNGSHPANTARLRTIAEPVVEVNHQTIANRTGRASQERKQLAAPNGEEGAGDFGLRGVGRHRGNYSKYHRRGWFGRWRFGLEKEDAGGRRNIFESEEDQAAGAHIP